MTVESNVDDDEATILRLMREARKKKRGYADFFGWEIDRKLSERNVAGVLCNYIAGPEALQLGVLSSNTPNETPDVILNAADGRRIGIEVTELVDQKMVEKVRHSIQKGTPSSYEWADWTASTIALGISDRIETKNGKLRAARGSYDELYLAIFTDEPDIDEEKARQALATPFPAAEFIDRAFLILGYQPNANLNEFTDGCPVLPIAFY